MCDDPTCGQRTRSMSVYGRRCLRVGCRGAVGFEVGSFLFYFGVELTLFGCCCSIRM